MLSSFFLLPLVGVLVEEPLHLSLDEGLVRWVNQHMRVVLCKKEKLCTHKSTKGSPYQVF